MLIKGYRLQDSTVLEIGKFSILWNKFENDWCNNNCNPNEIKKVSVYISLDFDCQAKFAEVLNRRCNEFGQSKEDYVKNSLHPRNARKSSMENRDIMLQFMQQDGEDLVCGCLLVLHRIRNNLMHGLKEINMLDGQIELFRTANAVLESLKRKD